MLSAGGKFVSLAAAVALAMAVTACGAGDGSSPASGEARTSTVQDSSSATSAPSHRAGASATGSAQGKAGGSTGPVSTPATSGAAPGGTPQATAAARRSVGVPNAAAVSLSIPSIGLSPSITAAGVSGGVLNPPGGVVQQLTGYGRVTPGKPGIAVLAGHVTLNGPDVFYSLSRTPVGGKVTVTYADGTSKDFVVTDKASIDKTALQGDARVWGESATPVIALVTCDAGSAWVNAQHHANNFVVWARPA